MNGATSTENPVRIRSERGDVGSRSVNPISLMTSTSWRGLPAMAVAWLEPVPPGEGPPLARALRPALCVVG